MPVTIVKNIDANDVGKELAEYGTTINTLENRQAAAQANSTATDVAGIVADFNALLAKLRTAGLLRTS